jgi:hypothetical protein
MNSQDAAAVRILPFSRCVLLPVTRCWWTIQPVNPQLVSKFSSAEKGFSGLKTRKKIMVPRKRSAEPAFSG